MKKIYFILICLTIAAFFSSCNSQNLNLSIDKGNIEEMKMQNTEINSEITQIQNYTMNKTEYGKETGTDKTFTGLEPLPLKDFSFVDTTNIRAYPTGKICHSFGVAKNELPHEISVDSQMHFDNEGFNALTIDMTTDKKVIYLTFDVGYDNGYTEKILDTLKEKNVPAAFFCTVDEMKSDPKSIARMINEGHIVGNHTENHPSMAEITQHEMVSEIKAFDDYIRTNFGYSSPYFRFPMGEYSDSALDVVGSMGYLSVFWSLSYADWDTTVQRGASYAHDTVVSRIHPGAVILLHAVSADNAQALGSIIDTVRSMGYNFVSLEEYKNSN